MEADFNFRNIEGSVYRMENQKEKAGVPVGSTMTENENLSK
jgi:hypothetical protein